MTGTSFEIAGGSGGKIPIKKERGRGIIVENLPIKQMGWLSVTLLFGAKDEEQNDAVALRSLTGKQPG